MGTILDEGAREEHTTVARRGLVVRQSSKAVLFFDDGAVSEIWFPKRQIVDWRFVQSGTKEGLRLEHLERNDEVELVITKWLAKKEGLIS